MEFNQKLQELRKQRALTQEELAEMLFVSRTAVSKWESGRGYPNIETLKNIAKLFSVTVDELLSGDELLNIAESDTKKTETHLKDMVFGLLDVSVILLLFLPLFAQRIEGDLQAVSLLSLQGTALWLKIVCIAYTALSLALGVLTLAIQGYSFLLWNKIKTVLSIILNLFGTIALILCLHPYAAVYLIVLLIIKVSLLIKFK